MPLNIAKGQMYGFITHTWSAVKGICPHQCSYCYMRDKWPQMQAPRLVESELKTKHISYEKSIIKDIGDLFGGGKETDVIKPLSIFVSSGIDLFAPTINCDWIAETIRHIIKFPSNTYLLQSKNPARFADFRYPDNTILCTTIETNRYYAEIMGTCPNPFERMACFYGLEHDKKMVTIEPVIDFDINIMLDWMIKLQPEQINIGADSGNNHLPEPSKEKLVEFIRLLKINNLKVFLKPNLNRLF